MDSKIDSKRVKADLLKRWEFDSLTQSTPELFHRDGLEGHSDGGERASLNSLSLLTSFKHHQCCTPAAVSQARLTKMYAPLQQLYFHDLGCNGQ